MPDILGDAGKSIADIYDVLGSVVGIEKLEATELPLVHEMGGTVFSERFSIFTRRSTVTVNQSSAFGQAIIDLPATPCRLLGVEVLTTDNTRISHATVNLRDAGVPREFSVWVWDQANALTISIDDGAGSVLLEVLVPQASLLAVPNFCGGIGQPQAVESAITRGVSTAFGAGTVTITTLLHLAFSEVGGLSSKGLPVPSW